MLQRHGLAPHRPLQSQHLPPRHPAASCCPWHAPAHRTPWPMPPGCKSAPLRPKPARTSRPGLEDATTEAPGSSPPLHGCPALHPHASRCAATRCAALSRAGSCRWSLRCCAARPGAEHRTRRTGSAHRPPRRCRFGTLPPVPRWAPGARFPRCWQARRRPDPRRAASPPASQPWSGAEPCGRLLPAPPWWWFQCGPRVN